MTDKERIKRDADEYVKRQGIHDRPDITKQDYISGATAERPKAWNEAIDAVVTRLESEYVERGDIVAPWKNITKCRECGRRLIGKNAIDVGYCLSCYNMMMAGDDDEDDFERCSECDGHDACEDFGCAIKLGLGHLLNRPL